MLIDNREVAVTVTVFRDGFHAYSDGKMSQFEWDMAAKILEALRPDSVPEATTALLESGHVTG